MIPASDLPVLFGSLRVSMSKNIQFMDNLLRSSLWFIAVRLFRRTIL